MKKPIMMDSPLLPIPSGLPSRTLFAPCSALSATCELFISLVNCRSELPFSLDPEWHRSLSGPVPLAVSLRHAQMHICIIRFGQFSPVNLALWIWLLAELKELWKWEENYFYAPTIAPTYCLSIDTLHSLTDILHLISCDSHNFL